jgi:DNA-binding transcriptional LysR family regulator
MNTSDIRTNDRFFREILPELPTFHAACLYKTRAQAGAKLDKEGQTVGRSIAKLEALLKEPLNGGFLVDPKEQRRVEPTDAGNLLLKFFEDIAVRKGALMRELATLQHGSDIRVATTSYAWLSYESELVTAYQALRKDGSLNPGGNFWEQDRVWEDIEAEVLQGTADVGLYSFPPSRRREFPEGLEQLNWVEEEFVLVVPKTIARQVRRERVSVRELSQILPKLPQVVHYRRSLGFDRTDLIEDYLRRQRVLPRYEGDWLFGVNTIAEIKETLVRKGGISFLPWPAVAQEHKSGLLTAYPLTQRMRPRAIKIIYRLHNCRSAVSDFIRAAKSLAGARRFPRKLRQSPGTSSRAFSL